MCSIWLGFHASAGGLIRGPKMVKSGPTLLLCYFKPFLDLKKAQKETGMKTMLYTTSMLSESLMVRCIPIRI